MQTQSDTPTGSASTNAESGLTTASGTKLSPSPHTASEYPNSVSSSESESESRRPKKGSVDTGSKRDTIGFEECCVLQRVWGPVLFKEELFKRGGLCTHPYLFCQSLQTKTAIPFACSGLRSLAVNRRAVLANKCVGGSYIRIFRDSFCTAGPFTTCVSARISTAHESHRNGSTYCS